jgi:hypothetical protein
MPSLPLAKRSAPPTPRPRAPSSSRRPIVIQNTLRLTGGTLPNATTTGATDATIQNIQAALACSLRLPPEQVRIRNITVTTVAGAIWNPPLPASLDANGTIICYNATVGSAVAAQFRMLSATADPGIAVEYSVEGDAAATVPLTSEELTTALVTNPMMVEIAASVGATGIAAATTDVSFAAAASPPSSAGAGEPSSSSVTPTIAAGIGAALAVLAVSAAVILGVLYVRRRPAAPYAPKSHTMVIVQDTVAAPPTSVMNPLADRDRIGFEPTQQRTRV